MATTPKEIKKNLKIAESIIKSQGSIFIKELLRKKKKTGVPVKIGANKSQSLEYLDQAIREGYITRVDLESWIADVEGWGKQHVYVYHLPEEFFATGEYNSKKEIEAAINKSIYSKYLNNEEEYKFPKKLNLSRIHAEGNDVTIIWQQRITSSKRDKDKDPPNKKIQGDEYEFHAHRIIPARSIMRFCIRPNINIAALFIQIPLGRDHMAAFNNAESVVKNIFKVSELSLFKLSKVIKAFDEYDNDMPAGYQPKLAAHNTKFSSRGASVEFSSDSTDSAWKTFDNVRQVRKSMVMDQFDGESGHFNVNLNDIAGTSRTVQMSINGKSNRIYFRAQMISDEVWSLLCDVEKEAR